MGVERFDVGKNLKKLYLLSGVSPDTAAVVELN